MDMPPSDKQASPAGNPMIPGGHIDLLTAFKPLKQPLFAMLAIAALVSNIGTWLQDVAAVWLMTDLTRDVLLISLMQAAVSVPLLFIGIPAGALADLFSRRRILLVCQAILTILAVIMGMLAWSGLINAAGLLLLTLAMGAATAVALPAWAALIPDLVPRDELPWAVALTSLGINLARAIGPAIGGVLVARSGPAPAFFLNALTFIIVMAVIWRYREPPNPRDTLSERLPGAIRAGMRYARGEPALWNILLRTFGYFLFAGASYALLPVVVKHRLHGSASDYGGMLGLVGVGALIAAVSLPFIRARLSRDQLMQLACQLYAVSLLALAIVPAMGWLMPVMILTGMGWIWVNAILQVAAQTVSPGWVHSRVLALYLVTMGAGLASGSVIWGSIGRHSVEMALLLAGVGMALQGWFLRPFSLSLNDGVDLTPDPGAPGLPGPDHGPMESIPVMVSHDYFVTSSERLSFLRQMHALRNVRLRNGGMHWRLFEHVQGSGYFREFFMTDGEAEFFRMQTRLTVTDRQAIQAVWHYRHQGNTAQTGTHDGDYWIARQTNPDRET